MEVLSRNEAQPRGSSPFLVLLLAVCPVASAEVIVRSGGDGRVNVQATSAPLSDVLDRLSRQTGMKVVYDGPPPRHLLTLTLDGRTPVQAVLGILEGLGLNYAVVMDATATRVQTLLMAGAATTAATSPSPPLRTPTPTARRRRSRAGPELQVAPASPQPAPEPDTAEDAPEEDSGPAALAEQMPSGGQAPATEDTVAASPPGLPMAPPGLPALQDMAPPSFPGSPSSPQLPPPTLVPASSPSPGTVPVPEATPHS